MSLKEIIYQCELMMAKFYGFDIANLFSDHIVSEKDLVLSPVEIKGDLKSGVFIIENKSEDELFIGACLDEKITNHLTASNPFLRLSLENINAFCVLVEEISHFHLLINRARSGLAVSKIELEWQAEIDKLLISAEMLRFQSGKSHILPLLRLVFDEGKIVHSTERQMYEQANNLAAKFWYKAVYEYKDPTAVTDFRATLQKLYRRDWDEKKAYCAR